MKVFNLMLAVLFAIDDSESYITEEDRALLCSSLECLSSSKVESVCGIRFDGREYRLKLFESECHFVKYNCDVKENQNIYFVVYGAVEKYYCEQAFNESEPDETNIVSKGNDENTYSEEDTVPKVRSCNRYECDNSADKNTVCGIRQDGDKFIIRLFKNKCDLIFYNCEHDLDFIETHKQDCQESVEDKPVDQIDTDSLDKKIERIIIIKGLPFFNGKHVNDTVEEFFNSTHSARIRLRQIPHGELTRRGIQLKSISHKVIFEPKVIKPKVVNVDYDHVPLLSTCFHKCLKVCPDIYAPICANPGVYSQMPSVMFKNHCYMDQAQCKFYYDILNNTRDMSYITDYQEASFAFCTGDEMVGMLRFVPMIRTLQRMGRLRQRGHFNYVFRNFKFLNSQLLREPKLQG